ASPYPLDEALFAAYGGRVVNLHAAPLPGWRGGGGLSWAIMSGDRQGGGTFHVLTPYDTETRDMHPDDGPVLRKFAFRYPDACRRPRDYETYFDTVAEPHMLGLLADLHGGARIALAPQLAAESRFLPRLNTDDHGLIDWSWPGDSLERFILAFSHPYPGARTYVRDGAAVRIFEARFVADAALQHPFIGGIVFRIDGGAADVACAGGYLRLPLAEIAAETALVAGDRLFTPRALLDGALATRSVYAAHGKVGAGG
ncbi:MAG: hypothetical protein VW644_14775, partial [Alphaproteobacteria bacterium]